MTFGAPMFLAALGLLLPVLIAFLVRRKRNVVRVPSTMIWRIGARTVAKNRRVRNVRRLLALLACLAGVAALVTAAARPSGRRGGMTVYVVDVSASMSGAPLEEARRFILRDVAACGPNARIAIAAAGAEARIHLPPSPPGPRVDEAIRGLVAESDVASMEQALALAEGLADPMIARVVVLSDHAVDTELSRRDWKAQQRVVARPVSADNVGIVGLYTRATLAAGDDEEREASVTVASSSSVVRRVRLVVELAGQRLAERRVVLEPRGEATERVAVRGAGRLRARVEPDDGRSDAMTIDDEASLEETAHRAPRVALVRGGATETASFFVAKAIRAAGVTDLVEADADGPAPEHAEVAVVLQDGSGRPKDVPTFAIGVPPPSLGLATSMVVAPATHVRSIATEEPLMRGVALDDATTMRANVARPSTGARTLLELDGGPALMAGGAGAASWVWLGIDPDASDLVLKVAFPVLVSNVLAHLGGASQVVVAKTVPRSETALEVPASAAPLANAGEPPWRIPFAPVVLVAGIGALLLALEAWLTFRKGWAT